MMDKKEGWHFLKGDKRLRFKPYTLIEPGMTVEAVGEIKLCQNGCHASERILDALKYAPGSLNLWVCRVLVEGEIQKDDDKFVGRKRTCLWMVDITDILYEFECRCAEDALSLIDKPDPRSIAAIAAKRAWVRGEISDEKLAVARAAAWDVARAAARAAAYVAADAVADVADAAYAAAYVANTATNTAAYTLANTAADIAYALSNTAAYADRCAAWNKYNRWLEETVTNAREVR